MNWKAFWNESTQLRDADCCRQVGRTFRGASYSEVELDLTVRRLLALLEPLPEKTLLDLGCGNGLITSRLAPHFRSITAIDFSRPLIEVAQTQFASSNVTYLFGDATDLNGLDGPYDCVLISAALQFFNRTQVARMFRQLGEVLGEDGRIVLGDIADRDRIWNFYKGIAGKIQFVSGKIRRRPVIGYWWRPSGLRRVAGQTGWTASIHYQPATLPNHYFRYDAVLERTALSRYSQEIQVVLPDR